MKAVPTRIVLPLVFLLTSFLCLCAGSLQAQTDIGSWDFESGDLTGTAGSTLGEMSYADGAGGTTQGATQFGTATSFTIPKINGVEAKVMKFPAATTPLGYAIPAPFAANGGGSLVNNYTIVFDLFYPAASSGKLRRLLQTDDGVLSGTVNYFSIDAANGIGAGSGPFHGEIQPNTWYRVGFVVNTDGGVVRKYINGILVGSQSSGSLDNRNALLPASIAKVLSSDDVNVAAGYVNSIQIRDVALSSEQMQALGGPSAAGIPIDIPPIPSFIDHWIPRGLVASRNTDIGAVIYTGETFIDQGTISLKLDNNVLANPDISLDGLLVTVRKANPSVFTPGSHHTIELKYTDDVAGQKTFTRQFTAALLFEDFEELPLGASVEEPIHGDNVWTKTPPDGWVQDDSGVPGIGDPSTDGRTEWAGWSFAKKDWWVQIAEDQNRSQFTLGEGTVAIADPDEWDDGSHTPGLYNTFINTPPISLTGVAANTVFVKFASSWRPECCDHGVSGLPDVNEDMTATLTVSYDGGAPVSVLRFDSDPDSPDYHPDATSELVFRKLNNPPGAHSMVLTFGLSNAGNDWWWAFDNLEVNAGVAPPVISVQPASQLASASATIAFDVEASGGEPLSYQWKLNGNNLTDGGRISGATSASLVITSVQAGDAGQYWVVVSNPGGAATSDKAALSVFSGSINQDLVVHLPFEDNYDDTSGRANNASAVNSPTFVDGKVGRAMHIGPGADYVTLRDFNSGNDAADLQFGTDTDFSFSFWTRAVAWGGDPSFISNKDWNSGSNIGYVLATDDDAHFQWNLAGKPDGSRGDRKDYDGPPGTFADHDWHHVVVTFQRSGGAVTYIDGIQRNVTPLNTAPNKLDTPSGFATNLGQDGTGGYGPKFTDMDMDDVGIWRRVLTVQEVASIYDQGVHGHDLSNARGDVTIPVSILAQPASQIISAGSIATLRVGVSGSPPLRFQWQKNGANISGATRGTLTIPNAQADATGDYRCIVSNPLGSVPSTEVRVAVFAGSIAQDLVTWLKFEDDYSDCSGRGNHAAPRGPSPDFAPGKVGEAFHFITTADGSTINYATLGQPADLRFGTSDFSVAFWINYTDAADDPPFISNKDWGSSSNIGWGLFHKDPTDFMLVNATGTPGGSANRLRKVLASPPVINDGAWHHIAASFWRGQSVHTYVDGQLVDTTPLTITGSVDPDFNYAVNIGQAGTGDYTDGGDAHIDALIDEVLLYRRAITPQDVAAIYTAGSQGRDPFVLLCGQSVSGGNVTLKWAGGTAPYTVQRKAHLSDANWEDVTVTSDLTATFPVQGATGFFRIVGS